MMNTSSSPPGFPKAILSVSREERYGGNGTPEPLSLTVRDGTTGEAIALPDDLRGHLFVIAIVGSVDSPPLYGDRRDPVLPSLDRYSPLINGDGMVYRLDFHETPDLETPDGSIQKDGGAWLASRLVATPSYWIDRALTLYPDKYPHLHQYWKFQTCGVARLSPGWGSRNQNNTALIPFKFGTSDSQLLVTADIGRPWEIDLRSLKLLAPIGQNSQWQPAMSMEQWEYIPFPPVMTSAHSVFDATESAFYTVNIVKSPDSLLEFSLWLTYRLRELKTILKDLITDLVEALDDIVNFVLIHLLKSSNDNLFLVGWKGGKTLQRWHVTLPDGKPIRILETSHQMGITENYIILANTSLKLCIDDFTPEIEPMQSTEAAWREISRFPQSDRADLYFISRKDLERSHTVTARHVVLDEALVHYVVDYQNAGDEGQYVLLHTAHGNAWDTAEFVHWIDRPISNPDATFEDKIRGMVSVSTDINHLVSYVIDAENGTVVRRSDVSYDDLELSEYPWSIAFYAFREKTNHQQPDRFENLYWNSWGLWGDLLTEFVCQMYRDYEPRFVPIDRTIEQAKTAGIPGQLCRVEIERRNVAGEPPQLQVAIADRVQFPPGYFCTSAQFVPREGSTDSSDGYLVCIAIRGNRLDSKDSDDADWSSNSEIWIFDATDLNRDGGQPRYKLSHPELNFGFTAHTTWLRHLSSGNIRPYDVRGDFHPWLARLDRNWLAQLLQGIDRLSGIDTDSETELRSLFENDVFPHFE
ncbi:carotenoid oxygenase family protein [Baaleninema simplex]|uniref:carotenoid oxygenase family protein n=1 Tax=Baaleninema simplex TaxID=2862350 RepID=UPI0009FF6373|nr:carotenoid oxygenase family protein [Baaleninema simplex]